MIYFMQAIDGGPIKIGKSVNVESRKAQLECRYGLALVVLKTIDGYAEEEAEMHRRFACLRIRRTEQFTAAPELIEFIGAGIPAQDQQQEMFVGGQKKLKAVRLDLDLGHHKLLRKIAAHEGMSMTQWVNLCVNRHLAEFTLQPTES